MSGGMRHSSAVSLGGHRTLGDGQHSDSARNKCLARSVKEQREDFFSCIASDNLIVLTDHTKTSDYFGILRLPPPPPPHTHLHD